MLHFLKWPMKGRLLIICLFNQTINLLLLVVISSLHWFTMHYFAWFLYALRWSFGTAAIHFGFCNAQEYFKSFYIMMFVWIVNCELWIVSGISRGQVVSGKLIHSRWIKWKGGYNWVATAVAAVNTSHHISSKSYNGIQMWTNNSLTP